jgi:fused signal recognition particle receptor
MEFITLFGTPKKKEPTVYEKIKAVVKQTKENFTEQIQDLVEGEKEINADMLEQLEAIMIGADIGVTTTNDILKAIKDRMSRRMLQDPKELRGAIKEELRKILNVNYTPPKEIAEGNPFVILMVGVNGVGKTTTIGKLAHRFEPPLSSNSKYGPIARMYRS